MAATKATLTAAFLLRLLALLLLVASIAILATDQFTPIVGPKTTFKSFTTYRYVLATSVIGAAYLLFQIPFALYMACKEKRFIRNECFSQFDFFADKLITFILVTGAAAGFAVTTEFKKGFKESVKAAADSGFIIPDDSVSQLDKFYDRANIASGLLFFAAVCMAFVSIFSSINRTWQSNGLFGR